MRYIPKENSFPTTDPGATNTGLVRCLYLFLDAAEIPRQFSPGISQPDSRLTVKDTNTTGTLTPGKDCGMLITCPCLTTPNGTLLPSHFIPGATRGGHWQPIRHEHGWSVCFNQPRSNVQSYIAVHTPDIMLIHSYRISHE